MEYITLPSNTKYDSLDLMAHNIKLLRNVGIFPNEGTDPKSWKWNLNRFYHSLIFMIYIPALILQAVSFCSYWGNIGLIVENIGTMSGLSACYFPALYMIFKWEEFQTMIYELERNSIFNSEMVRQNDKQMKIIQTSKKSAKILTWITIGSIISIGLSFDAIPLMRIIFSPTGSGSSQNIESISETFKYLVFVMWLPGDLTEDTWYWYLYTIQAVIVLVACAYLTAILPFLLTIIIYTETQFRLVTSSLNEIDERYEVGDADSEFITTGTHPEHALGNNDVHSLCLFDMHASVSTKVSDGPNSLLFSDGSNDPTASHVTSKEPDVASGYLVECIKLHQAVIEFSNYTNSVSSPILFIYFVSGTTMIITYVFQLSLEISLEYCCSLFFCLTQIFIYCYFGEMVITESLAVGEAAYRCCWYNRTNAFKRHILLILIRAQKPLYLSAGALWKMTIEFFSQILNTSYTFYTVLSRVNEV